MGGSSGVAQAEATSLDFKLSHPEIRPAGLPGWNMLARPGICEASIGALAGGALWDVFRAAAGQAAEPRIKDNEGLES